MARPAQEITLWDVVAAIDGEDLRTKCVVGFPQCNEIHHCDLHYRWVQIRQDIYEMLSAKSIADLIH